MPLFQAAYACVKAEGDLSWGETFQHTRHSGDFTRWKQHDDYQQAFTRLLRDLKAKKAKEDASTNPPQKQS